MKTIITLTDMPDGSVNVEHMIQMTTAETAAGLQPEQSPGYKCAMAFESIAQNAKAIGRELRLMHAEAIEKAEYGSCLH